MKNTLFWLLILVGPSFVFSEETVITKDGRSAILHDDGTWAYLKATATSEAGFRKVAWGSSKDIAKASEGKNPDYEESNYLVFKTTISGLESTAIYFYADDKLFKARYFFSESHTNKNDYIDDFNTIK